MVNPASGGTNPIVCTGRAEPVEIGDNGSDPPHSILTTEPKHPMPYTTIELSVADAVATIVLNRPDKLNSFTEQMHEELRSAWADIESAETVRCVLLTGAGRGFCAGQDLSDRRFTDGFPDLGDALERNYNRLIRTITGAAVPVVCAVNGVAAGAGANLALACDIVIAARSASFIQAFCRIGLVPDAGGTWVLPRLVGQARALGLAMLGERISADQALDWGMIWEVVDDDALAQRASFLARRLAAQPTRALGMIKRAIRLSTSQSLAAQLDLERDLQRLAGQTADYREGVAAFLDKRDPVFTGN